MNFRSSLSARLLSTGITACLLLGISVTKAGEQGEVISREKIIQKTFNENNFEGSVDLKKIVQEELIKPEECEEPLVVCQIKEVSFEVKLKKSWTKVKIPQLNDYDFANTVPELKSELQKLSKPEIVVLQEALARRGLLRNPDGSTVKERGFFGALTWMGLMRLASIKGLNPGDPKFDEQLKEQVNQLLKKMAKDQSYVANHPLPKDEHIVPKQGSPLEEQWKKYEYLGNLSQNAKRVNPGDIPLNGNLEVNIDGFVNVERAPNE